MWKPSIKTLSPCGDVLHRYEEYLKKKRHRLTVTGKVGLIGIVDVAGEERCLEELGTEKNAQGDWLRRCLYPARMAWIVWS